MAIIGNEQLVVLPQTAVGGPSPTNEIVTINDLVQFGLLNPGAFANLPTSSAGLAAGTLYNSGGFLCIA